MRKESIGYIKYSNDIIKFIIYNFIDNTKFEVSNIGTINNSFLRGKSISLPFNISKILSMQLSRLDWDQMADLACIYSPIENRIDVFNLSNAPNNSWLGFSLVVEAVL